MTEPQAPDSGAASADRIEANLAGVFAALHTVTTVGSPANPADLYAVVDRGVAAVEDSQPPFRCRSACFACCEGAAPVVTTLEWQALHAHLGRLPLDDQVAILRSNDMSYRYQVEDLLAAMLQMRNLPQIAPRGPGLAFSACPFLDEGKCLAYDARPLSCRAYGYATVTVAGETIPMMCEPALEQLKDTFPDEHVLLAWEPFNRRLHTLPGQSAFGHLPLWLLAQADAGGFGVPPVTDPLPWAKTNLRFIDS